MDVSDYIAIVSIAVTTIISIIGGVYAVANNTKKFELEENYKREMLEWYSRTVTIMTSIISAIDMEKYDYQIELSDLSAQIEIGRFYFPNVVKDNYGKNKPIAYQGYRNIVLDFLVYFYDTAKRKDSINHKKALREFLRLYTSSIFEVIAPRERIKKIKRYSDFSIAEEISLNDFLKDEDNFRRFYVEWY